MSGPGAHLRALAARLFDRSTMELVIDPLIADLQCEHADALSRGRLWRARWLHFASCIAFWKVAGLAALAANRQGARAIAIAFSAAALLTALSVCVVLANTPVPPDAGGKMVWLVLYLVPQALTISLPVCLALGLFAWLRGNGAEPSTRRTVLWLICIALLLAVANAGWATPAANNAYRNVIADRATLRGANELTFIELGQRVLESSPEDAGPLPLSFWFNARFALALSPVLLSVLALAGANARRHCLSSAVVASTLTVFVACYILFAADDIAVLARLLPAAAIAWLPNGLVMVATLFVAANQRSGQA
jgi:hypothetical protein